MPNKYLHLEFFVIFARAKIKSEIKFYMIIKNWVEIMYISNGKKISSNAKKILTFKAY